jgi:ubiquinone/menaquinone biosynthesis C-methylase UbiE
MRRHSSPQHRSLGRSSTNRDHTKDTSWQKVSPWYQKIVGDQGHYYHQHVVIPGVIRLLHLNKQSKLVDLGCGQGILARKIPQILSYLGLDASKSLIEFAQNQNKKPEHIFKVQDLTKPINKAEETFTHAAIVLALQNMKDAAIALKNAASLLETNGKLVIVLNHPAFRIPRQSGWSIDEKTKQQQRWVSRYRSPLEIPIAMHPGEQPSTITWSFHHSLHDYFQMLVAAGFVVTNLEEWYSDKTSVGKASKMENRARSEVPLFLTLVAHKK